MIRHWISCNDFTVEVQTNGTGPIIVRAAPLVRKFIGQPIGNLLNWAKGFGGLRHEILPEEPGSAQALLPERLRS